MQTLEGATGVGIYCVGLNVFLFLTFACLEVFVCRLCFCPWFKIFTTWTFTFLICFFGSH